MARAAHVFTAIQQAVAKTCPENYHEDAGVRAEFKLIIGELFSHFHPTMEARYLKTTEKFGVTREDPVGSSLACILPYPTRLRAAFESIQYYNMALSNTWYFAFEQLSNWVWGAHGYGIGPQVVAVVILIDNGRVLLIRPDQVPKERGMSLPMTPVPYNAEPREEAIRYMSTCFGLDNPPFAEEMAPVYFRDSGDHPSTIFFVFRIEQDGISRHISLGKHDAWERIRGLEDEDLALNHYRLLVR